MKILVLKMKILIPASYLHADLLGGGHRFEHAAHHLVRSGQRMPVPSKELGLGGERGRRLPSEGTSE